MIRLELGKRWALRDFVRIARAKQGKRGKRLERSARAIGTAFGAFQACAPHVEGMVPCVLADVLRSDLIHAYDKSTAPLRTMVARLKLVGDEQPCQYCGINPEADTLDHYLEKGIYPEFSVLYRNLVPSCGKCNRDRMPTIQAGVRAVLNLREDPIDQIPELLAVTVLCAGKGLKGRFSLKPRLPDAHPVAHIYARHFESLRLAERFSRASAKELAIVLQVVVDTQLPAKRTSFSRRRAERQLLSDASSIKVQNGPNDWRAALRTAAAASEEFLEACETAWRQRADAR